MMKNTDRARLQWLLPRGGSSEACAQGKEGQERQCRPTVIRVGDNCDYPICSSNCHLSCKATCGTSTNPKPRRKVLEDTWLPM